MMRWFAHVVRRDDEEATEWAQRAPAEGEDRRGDREYGGEMDFKAKSEGNGGRCNGDEEMRKTCKQNQHLKGEKEEIRWGEEKA